MKSATVTLSHSVFHFAFNQDVKLLFRIQWPTLRLGHPSNQTLRTYVSTTSLADSSSDLKQLKRCFFFSIIPYFVTYSIHLVAASYSATSVTRDRTMFKNRIRSYLQRCAISRLTLKKHNFFLVQLIETRLSLLVYHTLTELKKIIVIICNSFRY